LKTLRVNGKTYKLPGRLTQFQQQMYVHLIDWKWKYITEEAGYYKYKGVKIPYDAILPISVTAELPIIYPSVVNYLKQHQAIPGFAFRMHIHFNHMASSQAANVNLFLPILLHSKANDILSQIKSDFSRLATHCLYKGFRIECWDAPYGNLNDKTRISGTDSDMAIAYYNTKNELCLWLIEHKLTEKEFTACGGFGSKGRKQKHDCTKSFSEIIKNKPVCYYHDVRRFTYWDITNKHQVFFANHNSYPQCPFQGGMNQLWRNQLLGFAVEDDARHPFQHVYFSVVRHPDNKDICSTIDEYKELINYNGRFSDFTSRNFLDAALRIQNPDIQMWAEWYKALYHV